MPFERKTYDGSVLGGSISDTEWRDSNGHKIPLNKYAPPKRTRRIRNDVNEYDAAFRDDHDKDRYLITYADLITLLLGLFIILYAISNVDIEKYEKTFEAFGSAFGVSGDVVGFEAEKPLTQKIQPVKSLKQSLQEVIDENGYGKVIKLAENERGITVSIMDDILFASGKAEITDGSRDVLEKIAPILSNLPNDIRVEGHTDNVPINSQIFPSNWHLSVARATNTAYYLMHEEGLPQERVSIVGYSEFKPVAANDTPEGRSLNRRVDIVILKQY